MSEHSTNEEGRRGDATSARHSYGGTERKNSVLIVVALQQSHLLRALLASPDRPRGFDVHWCGGADYEQGVEFAQPAGIIAESVFASMERMAAPRRPLVNLTTHGEEVRALVRKDSPVAHVCIDEVSVGALAARHLVQAGCRHFGFVHYAGLHFSEIRRQSFVGELQRHGFTCQSCDRTYTTSGFDREVYLQFRKDLDTLLRNIPKPAGIMGADDYLGYEAAQSCQRQDLHVPAEVAVIGVNDDDMLCQITDVPLSSVMLPSGAQASLAWKTLLRMMDGEVLHDSYILVPATRIAVRSSTRASVAMSHEVASALEFIRINSQIKLSVNQVVDHVGVSRRTLQSRFEETLGRSIMSQIHLQRIEWHKEMLANPSLKIAAIARRAGFVQPERFTKFFKLHAGMTPTEFRATLRRDSGHAKTV